jgi:hypothetical protein
VLLNYVIDDEHVIDSNDPKQVERLDELVNIKDDPTGRELISIENDAQLRKRLQGRSINTDDNTGVKWR